MRLSTTSTLRPRASRRPLPTPPHATLVKICGLTTPADAAAAAAAGADLVGIIMWPKAKRGVTPARAAEIGAAARAAAAARSLTVVGVFVDGDAATIAADATAAGLDAIQLHGDGAREAAAELAGQGWPTLWVHAVADDGAPLTPPPPTSPPPSWVLVDGEVGGSGVAFDWGALHAPARGERGWLLAGGLTPETVAAAVAALSPDGVDVSSGVCGPDGLAKDHGLIAAFVAAAKQGG